MILKAYHEKTRVIKIKVRAKGKRQKAKGRQRGGLEKKIWSEKKLNIIERKKSSILSVRQIFL